MGPHISDKIVLRAVSSLEPYARNARTHSVGQVGQIAASIREFGFTNPVLVDHDGGIIAGHGRVMAARMLGLQQVPTIELGHLSEAQRHAYVIADNKLALNAGWDEKLLAAELEALREGDEIDLSVLGFNERELAVLLEPPAGLTDQDTLPPVPTEAVSQAGDLWVLGRHRLLCGSSLVEGDVKRLMGGERAKLFATDPPYAVGYRGGAHPAVAKTRANAKRNKEWSVIHTHADGDEVGQEFYEAFIGLARVEAIAEDAAWYCWHASARASMVERAWAAHGAFVHQQIIWAKSRPVLTFSVYLWQHEPCFLGWVKGHKPDGVAFGGELASTLWSVANGEAESKDHPTCKPAKLFQTPMLVHTRAGELCYEPFSGSGTQIIAAETLDRRCYAMEIAPVFVDVAVERWQAYTGEKAALDGDGRSFAEVAEARRSTASTKSSPL